MSLFIITDIDDYSLIINNKLKISVDCSNSLQVAINFNDNNLRGDVIKSYEIYSKTQYLVTDVVYKFNNQCYYKWIAINSITLEKDNQTLHVYISSKGYIKYEIKYIKNKKNKNTNKFNKYEDVLYDYNKPAVIDEYKTLYIND